MLFWNRYLVVALFGLISSAQDCSLTDVVTAFEKAKIHEDLHIVFQPQVLLEVMFPQPNGSSVIVSSGKRLEKNATLLPPFYRLKGNAGKGPFIVISIDPDAPTPKNRTLSDVRHFMGGNYFLSDPHDPFLLVNTTVPTTFYHEPRPIRSSDPHRYIFLVYHQSDVFNSQTMINSTSSIAFFTFSQFMSGTGFGQAIGGIFMQVGPDAHLPIESTTPPKTQY